MRTHRKNPSSNTNIDLGTNIVLYQIITVFILFMYAIHWLVLAFGLLAI